MYKVTNNYYNRQAIRTARINVWLGLVYVTVLSVILILVHAVLFSGGLSKRVGNIKLINAVYMNNNTH